MDEAIAKVNAELAEQEAAEPISNFIAVQGDKKTVKVPRSMSKIVDEVLQRTNNWPRRIDQVLFVDDPEHGLSYFDKRTTPGLFGWLQRRHKVEWMGSDGFVSQAEFFAEVERTAKSYEGIELYPHEPPVANIYYRHAETAPGDGSHLKWLLDRFRPETSVDRDLIQAAFLTAFWGGPAGRRPAFVITSDDGRGVGKSTVAEIVGYLCGGHLSFSAGEDITTMKTRLLTPSARERRIALMDNVKTMRFSWAELESLITESVISGKQLYVGEGQRPNLLTWFITINGASMATDMAQRSVIIKIVKGENEGKWWESTCKFIDDHRHDIIGDIRTQLRTAAELPADFRFSRWATWEQHVLCRLPEPMEAQRLILERQGDSDCETDEAEIVEEYFADQLAQRGYHPATCQMRIPVQLAAPWFCEALNRKSEPTNAISRRMQQMADEGQLKRISKDKSRKLGRCFIWTGAEADTTGDPINNALLEKKHAKRHYGN